MIKVTGTLTKLVRQRGGDGFVATFVDEDDDSIVHRLTVSAEDAKDIGGAVDEVFHLSAKGDEEAEETNDPAAERLLARQLAEASREVAHLRTEVAYEHAFALAICKELEFGVREPDHKKVIAALRAKIEKDAAPSRSFVAKVREITRVNAYTTKDEVIFKMLRETVMTPDEKKNIVKKKLDEMIQVVPNWDGPQAAMLLCGMPIVARGNLEQITYAAGVWRERLKRHLSQIVPVLPLEAPPAVKYENGSHEKHASDCPCSACRLLPARTGDAMPALATGSTS